METEENAKKKASRKWIVTVWAMTLGTLIVGFACVCSVMGFHFPDGLISLAILLCSTGIAYIGGNVWQKQILHKEASE